MHNLIEHYLQKTKSYSSLRFVLELSIVSFLFKILFTIFVFTILSVLNLLPYTDNQVEKDMLKFGWIIATLFVIVFASLETIIGQMLPIWFISRFTKRTKIIILLSALIFSLMHIDVAVIISVFPIAIFLSWSYFTRKKISLWNAFWVTTSIHIIHNLFVLFLVYLSI